MYPSPDTTLAVQISTLGSPYRSSVGDTVVLIPSSPRVQDHLLSSETLPGALTRPALQFEVASGRLAFCLLADCCS